MPTLQLRHNKMTNCDEIILILNQQTTLNDLYALERIAPNLHTAVCANDVVISAALFAALPKQIQTIENYKGDIKLLPHDFQHWSLNNHALTFSRASKSTDSQLMKHFKLEKTAEPTTPSTTSTCTTPPKIGVTKPKPSSSRSRSDNNSPLRNKNAKKSLEFMLDGSFEENVISNFVENFAEISKKRAADKDKNADEPAPKKRRFR